MLIPSRGQGRIGVLLPFTNVNLEADYAALCPAGISFHYSRIGGYDVDEIPDAKQMAGLGEAPLDEPLRLLAGAQPDVILYGCTSATLNQAMLFVALQILGLDREVPNGGQLFKSLQKHNDLPVTSQRQNIISPHAPAGAGPYAQAVCAGGFIFLSGIGSLDVKTHAILGDTVAEQTRITMSHISHILAAHGATLEHVVKMGIYLQNPDDYDAFDAVYAEYFTQPYPARLTIGAGQVWDMLIKMDCVAYIGEDA